MSQKSRYDSLQIGKVEQQATLPYLPLGLTRKKYLEAKRNEFLTKAFVWGGAYFVSKKIFKKKWVPLTVVGGLVLLSGMNPG